MAQAQVAGRPTVVLYEPGVLSALDAAAIARSQDVGTATAFDRRLDGRTLSFEAAGEGRFRDRETASTWDITGRAVAGELRGERLELVADQQFWFTVAAFLPDARILD